MIFKFKILILFLLIFSVLFIPSITLAQNDSFGVNDMDLVLDQDLDPVSSAVNIVNIALSFLGLISVIIIIYGGFVWMTSGGSADKVDRAKKILINGLIGLVLILLSWGIATFIINFFSGGDGGTGGISCTSGEVQEFFYCEDINGDDCFRIRTCSVNGTWGNWVINCNCLPTGNGEGVGAPCDSEPDLDGCFPDSDECDPGLFCSPDNCTCQPKGGLGDPCSSSPDPDICIPDNERCGLYLTCSEEDDCTCQGPPVITRISPVGGFCNGEIDKPCLEDSDCGAGDTCNTDTPNGAKDNFITISGHNFGTYESATSSVLFHNSIIAYDSDGNPVYSDDISGVMPKDVNSNCIDTWTNNQIIIAIPSGVSGGPITVVASSGKVGSTNDDLGPAIPNFQPNNISRPGLCSINPDTGLMGEEIEYQGVNLFDTSVAHFGSYTSSVTGLNSVFSDIDGLEGESKVPNVRTGLMSTFVRGTVGGFLLNSNYINFNKESEPDPGPYITSFSPTKGRAGQYVTIHGGGFGNNKGGSTVFFGGTEASYDFPEVCLQSVWTNNTVIIKVPDAITNGNYTIKMNIGGEEIDTVNLNPNFFEVDENLPLTPSLCKISPIRGQAGVNVTLWGEYFGQSGDDVFAIFHLNKEVSGSVEKDVNTDFFSASVPAEAISGPLKVKDKDNNEGNSLNFEIGPCEINDDCGPGNFCCPLGSYKANRCEANLNDCFIDVPNSVFEWSFSTDISSDDDEDPENGSNSCRGLARALGACQIDAFCPNSPGLCSITPAYQQSLGLCDSSCNNISGCEGDACSFLTDLDRCLLDGEDCNLNEEFTYNLNGQSYSTTRVCKRFPQYNNQSHWQITVSTSCPSSWFSLGGGVCVSSTSSVNSDCETCIDNFTCVLHEGLGQCVSQKLCPGNSICDQDTDECLIDRPELCECCCRVDHSAQDCCFPTECIEGCGDSDDPLTGYCTGCVVYDEHGDLDKIASNQVCNCPGHSGKFCDTSVIDEGVCADCSILDEAECKENEDQCCLDHNNNCTSGDGTEHGGYCSENSLAQYCNSLEEDDCKDDSVCCYDYNEDECIVGGEDDSLVDGYCKRWNCKDEPNDDQCNIDNPIKDGSYLTEASCNANCSNHNLGVDCFSKEDMPFCNFNLCGYPFNCLKTDGEIATSFPDCGTCCCSIASDNCSLLHPNLYCFPDQDPCSGNDRGLCCGCENDIECGGGNDMGCDFNTCCRARPEVEDGDLLPANGAEDVCRNAVIKVPFSQRMNIQSLRLNVRLLEERTLGDDSPCPGGTLAFKDENKPKIFNRFLTSVRNLWNRLFFGSNLNTALAADKFYCLVPGSIQVDQGPVKTTAYFQPNNLLKDDTKYYILVIGDKDLDSNTGVKSFWEVGMNGDYNESFNDVTYNNSFVSSFTTMSDQETNAGICVIDYALVTPPSYLFNTHENDPNEEDGNPDDPTFDTKRDKDKVFLANAYTFDDQIIFPVEGYSWTWKWTFDDNVIQKKGPPPLLDHNQIFVKAKPNIFDASTNLTATVEMNISNTIPGHEDGDGVSNYSDVNVFICRNPWPAIRPTTFEWNPWIDTCDGVVEECSSYYYKFYYCRDDKGITYADDLPAVIDPAIILGVGSNFICSSDHTPCSTLYDPCGDSNEGICIWNYLKESYFFRQARPSGGTITSAVDLETGGEIRLTWSGGANLIDHAEEHLKGKYRVYYAKEVGGNFEYIDVELIYCNLVGDNYNCNFTVSDLENNESYRFRVAAISWTNVETLFSNEVTATPTNKSIPDTPICNYEVNIGENSLRFICNNLEEDFNRLKLYVGTSSGVYTSYYNGQVDLNSMSLPLNQYEDRVYYFALTANDIYGNESEKSDEIEIDFYTCGGASISFNYNNQNVTYNVIKRDYVGDDYLCWLDRNLGATRACQSSTDHRCYGDLFQWGRGADGHQLINWTNPTTGVPVNETTEELSEEDQPGHSLFIINDDDATNRDWLKDDFSNDNLWQKEDGINNPCPPGFRVPTEVELNKERQSWIDNDSSGAFNSSLKWPVAGLRTSNGSLFEVGSLGYVWSSFVSSPSSRYLHFRPLNAYMRSGLRAAGRSVRCLRD